MTDERPVKHASSLHGAASEVESLVKEQAKPRRWRRRAFAYVGIGTAIGLLIVGVIKLLNDPVVSAGSTAVFAATPSPSPASMNILTGLTIELKYPATFDELARINTDAQAIEQYNLSSKAEYRRSIAVSVHPLPSGHLDDDSSYKFRLISPQVYSLSSDKIGAEPVAIMTKNDHTERTLFWAHGSRVLIVAITSTASVDNVNSFMTAVMPTIRWRQ